VPRSAHSAAELASRLGRQRESLAAIRNVEQLLASIHAGPKVIESLIPEVGQLIGPMREDTERLALALDAESGSPVRELALHEQGLLDQLERALSQCAGPLSAKKRLALERQVRSITPELGRVVEHWELLVDSVTGGGVTLPLGELLSSRPDHGSSRPLRRLLVFGAPVDVLVTLPPRAALGALSLLAEVSRVVAAPAIYVAREAGDLLSLEFKAPPAAGVGALVCMIPFVAPLPISREVALWVLVRIGARPFQAGDARIRLPIHPPGG
jgi:hypothetical protein